MLLIGVQWYAIDHFFVNQNSVGTRQAPTQKWMEHNVTYFHCLSLFQKRALPLELWTWTWKAINCRLVARNNADVVMNARGICSHAGCGRYLASNLIWKQIAGAHDANRRLSKNE